MRYSYAGYYEIRRYGLIDTYPTVIGDVDTFNTELGTASTANEERDRVMNIAMDVSQAFERFTERTFMPLVETRFYDAADNDQIFELSNVLKLDDALMSLTSVTLGNTQTPTVGTQVVGRPKHITPIQQLQLIGLSFHWTSYSVDWRQAIEIAGIWGYRSNFSSQGFIDSGDDIKNGSGIIATETAITVAAADGLNGLHVAPRFDIGQLIRVTTDDTDEYMVITDVNYGTNTLTVLRGQRGTTGAVHLEDTEIYVFQPEPDLVRACAAAVDFEYSNLGKHETVQVSNIPGAKQTTIQPELWPASVMRALNYYKRRTVRSAGGAGISHYG